MRSCMTTAMIRLTQRLACAFSEQSTASCCRRKLRTWLAVIPRQAAIVIVMGFGQRFTTLCNNIPQSYASWYVARCKPMKWAGARLC